MIDVRQQFATIFLWNCWIFSHYFYFLLARFLFLRICFSSSVQTLRQIYFIDVKRIFGLLVLITLLSTHFIWRVVEKDIILSLSLSLRFTYAFIEYECEQIYPLWHSAVSITVWLGSVVMWHTKFTMNNWNRSIPSVCRHHFFVAVTILLSFQLLLLLLFFCFSSTLLLIQVCCDHYYYFYCRMTMCYNKTGYL